VRAALIEAADEKEALEILNNHQSLEGKVLLEHTLHWGETPTSDIVHERDGVLAEFLKLMQDEIPRSSARTIIIPRPPSGE
jgi:hypothetical protein